MIIANGVENRGKTNKNLHGLIIGDANLCTVEPHPHTHIHIWKWINI